MSRYDAIVIGAGANGLAHAALLAKKRKRVLVLERRDAIGGSGATEEFHPGFRANACRDGVDWIPAALLRELDLAAHGLRVMPASAGLVRVDPDAPMVGTYPDAGRTVAALATVSGEDAARWNAFCAFTSRVTSILEAAYSAHPPRIQSRALGDLMLLAGLGRRLRSLGKREMMEVLRVTAMPVADLAEEWFRHEDIRTMVAVQGTTDVMHGPMSGGTALVFLHRQVGQALGSIGVRQVVRGGTVRLAEALAAAARALGVEIRLGAQVHQVGVREGRATGVVLSTGEVVDGGHVISSADPRRSFGFVDAKWLDPALLLAVDNIRFRGSTARVHFALDGLPTFRSGGKEVPRDALGGTVVLARSVAAVERACDAAKYGDVPEEPALTLALPTLADPTLAPERRHVLSVSVHHVPHARRGGWDATAAESLANRVTDRLAACSPDLRNLIVGRTVLTPVDIETRYGCTEGSLSQGELALDQFAFMRPVPQCARYATPLAGFWLCGAGSHPANASGASGLLAARAVLASR